MSGQPIADEAVFRGIIDGQQISTIGFLLKNENTLSVKDGQGPLSIYTVSFEILILILTDYV